MVDVNDTGPTLAELLQRKALREAEADREAEALEREVLLLEEKHEGLGKLGKDYRVVATAAGCIVLRKPEFVVAKRFNAIPAEKRGEEEVITFVTPSVVEPDRARFNALVLEHGGIAWRCAQEVLEMYEAAAARRRGKS